MDHLGLDPVHFPANQDHSDNHRWVNSPNQVDLVGPILLEEFNLQHNMETQVPHSPLAIHLHLVVHNSHLVERRQRRMANSKLIHLEWVAIWVGV